MTLQKWANVSDVLASVAIVVTLLILVQEVRNNTVVQERQMQMERVLNSTDAYLNTPELADIFAKVKAVDGQEPVAGAYEERYGLTPSEAVIWSRLVQRTLFIWHSQFLFGGPSEALESEITSIFKYPDLRLAYEINEDGLLSPAFIEYVDSIVDSIVDTP